MASNPVARHGGLSYLEVAARDPDRCGAFYAATLGWRLRTSEGGERRFDAPDGLMIGHFRQGEARGASYLPYFYVDDVDAAVSRAKGAGGTLVEAARDEADLRLARMRDTEGNDLGLWHFRR